MNNQDVKKFLIDLFHGCRYDERDLQSEVDLRRNKLRFLYQDYLEHKKRLKKNLEWMKTFDSKTPHEDVYNAYKNMIELKRKLGGMKSAIKFESIKQKRNKWILARIHKIMLEYNNVKNQFIKNMMENLDDCI